MIVARKVDPQDVATVTVGAIHGGTKENIIPEYAELIGAARTLKSDVRQRVIEGLHEVCRGACEAVAEDDEAMRWIMYRIVRQWITTRL